MISVVLPCYNPPENWEHTVAENYNAITAFIDQPVELVLVNDGSARPFGPAALGYLEQHIPHFSYLDYEKNMGKGYALREGVKAAAGGLIIYTDTDFPYTTASMVAVYRSLSAGNDIAIGVKNERYYSQVPFMRRRISKFLRRLIRVFLAIPVTDTQCGLKGFRAEHKGVFLGTTINRYLFDLEFVYNSFKHEPALKVEAVPVELKPSVFFREMRHKELLTEFCNFIRILIKRR